MKNNKVPSTPYKIQFSVTYVIELKDDREELGQLALFDILIDYILIVPNVAFGTINKPSYDCRNNPNLFILNWMIWYWFLVTL